MISLLPTVLRRTGYLIVLCILGFSPRTSVAQSAASIPPVDPATYQSLEECLAWGLRESYWGVQHSEYLDTLPITHDELWKGVPDSVQTGMARCAVKYQPASADMHDWFLLVKVFMLADREDDARAMVTRRLAAIPPTAVADTERAQVIDSLMTLYMRWARPARWGAIDTLYPTLMALPLSAYSPESRVRLTNDIFVRSYELYQDTARARQYAERLRNLNQSFTEEERATMSASWLSGLVFGAIIHLNRTAGLDSLRNGSVAGYVTLVHQAWNEAIQREGGKGSFPGPWGKEAPILEGQVFTSAGVGTPRSRPTRGKVALVVFVHENKYGGKYISSTSKPVWNLAATLRRLHAQFPELEIDVVADHPSAAFWTRVALDSAVEGDLWRQWLIGFHRIPGAVIVERSDFFRIPTPEDRRLVLLRAKNPAAYRGDLGLQSTHMGGAEGFLVARSGVMVKWISQGVSRTQERELAEEIDLLLKIPQ